MRKYIPQILIGILCGVLGVGIGFYFWGNQKPADPVAEHSRTIDSLMILNQHLRDSVAAIDADYVIVYRDRIKHEIAYDTIVKYEDTQQILNSLNQIANTPVE